MVSAGGMAGLGVAVLISIGAPVLVYFVCRGRMNLRVRNILVGAACFIVFALVLEGLLNRFLIVINPATAAWFKAHPIAFVFYGAFAAGIFEETARLFGLSFLVRKEDGAGVAYGIGHGGAEAVIIGALGIGQSIFLAMLLNQGKLAATLGSRLPPGALEKIHTSLEHLTFFGALPGGVERVSAVVFQIALSLLVWRAVRYKKPVFYIAAIFAHAAIDFPAAMIQAGLLHLGVWTIEAGYGAAALAILVFLLLRMPSLLSREAG